MAVSKTLNPSSLVSSLGLRRARAEGGVNDEDYVSLGKTSIDSTVGSSGWP